MGALGFGAELSVGRGRGLSLPPVFDFTAGVLPPGATLTRGSGARRCDATGTLVGAAADVARFDHYLPGDPAGPGLRGLLIEPAATNLLPWSDRIELFGEKSGCSVAADVGPAPDGSAGFDRIVPSVGSGVFPYVADTSFAKVAGATYTFSLFVRYDSLRWALLAGDLYGGGRHAWFDLATGTVGTRGGNVAAAAIVPAGAATWRIAVTFIGTTSPYCLLAPVKADATFGADYAAGDAMGAWGAMLELGAAATSPVATKGAAATRAADVLTLDWRGRGVGDGPVTVRYGFDDGSAQDVAATVAGGLTTVPTTLNRSRLRRAALI